MLEASSIFDRCGPLGFGGAAVGNLFEAVSDDVADATIASALAVGLTYIDTAPHYGFGLSEKRLGRTLAERDPDARIVLSTKIGRTLAPVPDADTSQMRQAFITPEPFESRFDYSYDAVMRSFEESCRRLGRERIDILYAHDLGRATHGDAHPTLLAQFLDGGYRAMRVLRDEGRVGAIGLGVNEWQVCVEAMAQAEFDVMLLAGRYTLLDQSPLDRFFPECAARNVAVMIGGPYNSGILAAGTRGTAHYDYGAVPPAVMERVAALERVCDSHTVPLAAAALQFPLAYPQVVSVIAGLKNPAEVEQAAAMMAWEIPTALWSDLRDAGLIRNDAPVPVAIAPRSLD